DDGTVALPDLHHSAAVAAGEHDERVVVRERVRGVAEVEPKACEVPIEIQRPHRLPGRLVERMNLTDAACGHDTIADHLGHRVWTRAHPLAIGIPERRRVLVLPKRFAIARVE